ncbi:MAG TPA: hypothetical protein VJL28_05495 [Gemmatimonadaceae bacterium]|nr:hypothetical protein [Gemmatimonadaceae bacterium]
MSAPRERKRPDDIVVLLAINLVVHLVAAGITLNFPVVHQMEGLRGG